MNFVLDENIPLEIGPWLNKKGHNTFSAVKGSPDEDVACLAKKMNAIILSQDRHFANALKFPPKDFMGIVRIKIHPSYIEDITLALERLLRIFSKPEDFKTKLIILEKDGFFKLKE